MGSTVLMICCYFENIPTHRGYTVYRYFHERYDTQMIYSAYSHPGKRYVTYENADFIPVYSLAYQKNLSFRRIFSYIDFAWKTYRKLQKENLRPSLIYVQLPPNSSAFAVIRYARKNKIPVVVDILDLWPESLPFPGWMKKIIDCTIGIPWKYFRNASIPRAGCVISESRYFLDRLGLSRDRSDVAAVSLSKVCRDNAIDFRRTDPETIALLFLGGINSISDFASFLTIAEKIAGYGRPVRVELIGDGKNRDWLLQELTNRHIEHRYHGKVYDEKEKKRIIERCWLGFNGYKVTTEVALSYKSIDYLSYSLPIINNTKGDTWDLVDHNRIGFNYCSTNLDETARQIARLNYEDILEMRRKAAGVFADHFDYTVFEQKMDHLMARICPNILKPPEYKRSAPTF